MCLPRKIAVVQTLFASTDSPNTCCVSQLALRLVATMRLSSVLWGCLFVFSLGGATVVDEAGPHLLRVASWFASGEGVAQRCQAFSSIRSVRRAVVRHLGDFYSCPAQKLREG